METIIWLRNSECFHYSESFGELDQGRRLGPHPSNSDSTGLGWAWESAFLTSSWFVAMLLTPESHWWALLTKPWKLSLVCLPTAFPFVFPWLPIPYHQWLHCVFSNAMTMFPHQLLPLAWKFSSIIQFILTISDQRPLPFLSNLISRNYPWYHATLLLSCIFFSVQSARIKAHERRSLLLDQQWEVFHTQITYVFVEWMNIIKWWIQKLGPMLCNFTAWAQHLMWNRWWGNWGTLAGLLDPTPTHTRAVQKVSGKWK